MQRQPQAEKGPRLTFARGKAGLALQLPLLGDARQPVDRRQNELSPFRVTPARLTSLASIEAFVCTLQAVFLFSGAPSFYPRGTFPFLTGASRKYTGRVEDSAIEMLG